MYPIHLAIAKYGEDNFEFKILEWTDDFNNKEKEYIKTLNTICPSGYNIAEGGSNMIMFGEDHPRNTLPESLSYSYQRHQSSHSQQNLPALFPFPSWSLFR